jgi:SAM-dependent methyltransferase
MPWIPAQQEIEEWLDLGAGTADQRHQSLEDLRRINRWLGGAAASGRELVRLAARTGLVELSVLDLGTGSADLPAAMQRRARQAGLRVKALAIDLKLEHLHIARRELETDGADVALACADALRLPFREAAVDVVHSALFLHHFRPSALQALLREALRVARRAVVMNDLVRHRLPLLFLRAAAPLVARSPITRHDGVASLLRAYTPAELLAIARSVAGDHCRVRTHFPYRQCLVIEKPGCA